MKRCLFSLLVCLLSCIVYAQQNISLAGTWGFGMGKDPVYEDSVVLPGSMLTNGKGDPITNKTKWTASIHQDSYLSDLNLKADGRDSTLMMPYFLTPERTYVGYAWYRRSVVVPGEWRGKRITLFLERPHIETTVFVNGKRVGHQESLSVPHQYDVTSYIKIGGNNLITVCVYNGIENVGVGMDSHSVSDHSQGNWNGIVGRMELRAAPVVQRIRVIPHLEDKSVDITINDTTVHFDLGNDAEFWSEFNPKLYTRTVTYNGVVIPITFGLRHVSIKGRQIYLNGIPIFLRGTVENCCFPLTGYPPMDEDEWLRVFRKCKEYGLNHVRFHSFCPPEAAFCAADKVGIYLQVEGPTWPNHGVRLGRGMRIDHYLPEETKRIVDTYGHHPSFIMMAIGNEPTGAWVDYCNKWLKEMKQYDSTKIYTAASVGGSWDWTNESQYHVRGGMRGIFEWNGKAPSSDDDFNKQIDYPTKYNGNTPNSSPIISHEHGQWCAFPDFREISQYTGVYKARNLELYQELLRRNGMESMAGKFLNASGRLQTLAYKYDLERNLRTKDYAGFQLLGLNDYTGQGTAVVGVLNVFWREKDYCTADDWREFCSPIVPLARFPKFVFTSDESLCVPIELVNANGKELRDYSLQWQIRSSKGKTKARGKFHLKSVPIGKNCQVDTIRIPLSEMDVPAKYVLTVFAKDGSARNHWEFWVYPANSSLAIEDLGDIHLSSSFDTRTREVLQQGGTVLLTAAGKVRLGSEIKQTYLPVFWNSLWLFFRPPHTTGAYIDTQHPLFDFNFPSDSWGNLNWWELLNKAQVMDLRELPVDYMSPIQPIDTWQLSRKLGMLIEAKVGKGKLLMTTMDISSDLENRPVARQMRQAILSYMQSKEFQPKMELSDSVIIHLFDGIPAKTTTTK